MQRTFQFQMMTVYGLASAIQLHLCKLLPIRIPLLLTLILHPARKVKLRIKLCPKPLQTPSVQQKGHLQLHCTLHRTLPHSMQRTTLHTLVQRVYNIRNLTVIQL